MIDMSAEELVLEYTIAVRDASELPLHVPKEDAENLRKSIIDKIESGERAVKAMEQLSKISFDFDSQPILAAETIIRNYNMTQEARKC